MSIQRGASETSLIDKNEQAKKGARQEVKAYPEAMPRIDWHLLN